MSSFRSFYPSVTAILPIILLSITATAVAQSSAPSETFAPDPVITRIERARALAAAHQLRMAASELESVRAATSDASIRNISTLMLIGIYLEEGNYIRPVALLDEAFQYRATQKDDSVRTYFALAGQAINGVRTRLARYRSFGINVGDGNLPQEALKDLDQIRFLLERLVAHANELTNQDGRAYEAWALKEDLVALRVSVARDLADRGKWESEHAAAREKLATRQIQIASIGRPLILDAVTAKIPNPFATTGPPPNPSANTEQAAPQNSAPQTPASSSPVAPAVLNFGSLNGRELTRTTPIYPPIARTNRVGGKVRVFILVDENGKVTVTKSEGPALLLAAAEEAARGWVFPPMIVDGRGVTVSGYLDFEFRL